MAERLREVSEELAGADIDLFGQQAHVVHVGSGSRESGTSPVEVTGQRLGLGQPERS